MLPQSILLRIAELFPPSKLARQCKLFPELTPSFFEFPIITGELDGRDKVRRPQQPAQSSHCTYITGLSETSIKP